MDGRKTSETWKRCEELIAQTPKEQKLWFEWSFHIADVIDDRMKELGMSKMDLARKCGTSAAAVTRWLGGGYDFKLSTLARISAVLDIPIIDIFKQGESR